MNSKLYYLIHGLMASMLLLFGFIFISGAFAQTATTSLNPTITTSLPKPSLLTELKRNLGLSYYMQVLGPSPALPSNQTYNVFIESESPLQTFHAASLFYKLPRNFGMSASFAAIQHFSDSVETTNGKVENDYLFFNPRLNLHWAPIVFKPVTFYHTLGYEFAANTISQDDGMKRGYVFSQSIAANTPFNQPWSGGWMTQLIRYEYEENVKSPSCSGCSPTPLQTVIFSTGPYLNYRLNDSWMFYNIITFDWDQRGNQTGTTQTNNNLPDRWRLGARYFVKKNPFGLQNLGLFTQGLIQASAETTVLGADLSFRF